MMTNYLLKAISYEKGSVLLSDGNEDKWFLLSPQSKKFIDNLQKGEVVASIENGVVTYIQNYGITEKQTEQESVMSEKTISMLTSYAKDIYTTAFLANKPITEEQAAIVIVSIYKKVKGAV